MGEVTLEPGLASVHPFGGKRGHEEELQGSGVPCREGDLSRGSKMFGKGRGSAWLGAGGEGRGKGSPQGPGLRDPEPLRSSVGSEWPAGGDRGGRGQDHGLLQCQVSHRAEQSEISWRSTCSRKPSLVPGQLPP